MSKRSDIKDYLVSKYEAIDKVRTVSTKYKTLDQVDKSRMPYMQLLSVIESRKRLDSNKNTGCTWKLSLWCYVQDEGDIETWVENIRDATNDDRTCGGYARDCYIEEFYTDNALVGSTVRGVIIAMIVVEYKVKD